MFDGSICKDVISTIRFKLEGGILKSRLALEFQISLSVYSFSKMTGYSEQKAVFDPLFQGQLMNMNLSWEIKKYPLMVLL